MRPGKWLTVTVLILVFLPWPVSASQKTLSDYKDAYAKLVKKVDDRYEVELDAALKEYTSRLAQTLRTVRMKGDLDGLIALKNETERFEREKTVPETDPDDTGAPLAEIRSGYRLRVAKATLNKNKSTVALTKKYVAALDAMKSKLVREDKIDVALDVKAEIDRGEFIVADIESKMPKADAKPVVPDPSGTLQGSPPKFREGLILYYGFDSDEDGLVLDRSDGGNDGHVFGPVSYVQGISGKGIRITSSDAYVESRAKGVNMDGWLELTVSVWFKPEDHTTYGSIINRANTDGSRGATMYLYIGGRGAATGGFSCMGSVRSDFFQRGQSAPTEQWYHLVGTLDHEKVRLYVNGRLDAENTRAKPGEPIRDDAARALTIGKYRAHREHWRDSYPHGVIDEVKIWKRTLPGADIKQLYESQMTHVGRRLKSDGLRRRKVRSR